MGESDEEEDEINIKVVNPLAKIEALNALMRYLYIYINIQRNKPTN